MGCGGRMCSVNDGGDAEWCRGVSGEAPAQALLCAAHSCSVNVS